jgi:hypothetical protein
VASRSNFSLLYGVQTAWNTPLGTGLKPLRLSTWDPGTNFQTIEDDSLIPGTRLGGASRAGVVRLAPTFDVNYGTDEYDTWLSALFQGAWATNVLKQGNTPTWMTVEDRQSDATANLLLSNLIPNTLRVVMRPNGMARTTFGCLATTVSGSAVTTTTPVAAGTDRSFDTLSGTLLYGGAAFDMSSLELTMDSRGEARDTLFQRYANRIVFAPDRVTFTFACVYTGLARFTDTLNQTRNAISFTLNGATQGGTPTSHTWLLAVTQNTGWTKPMTTDPEVVQTITGEVVANLGTKVQITRA